ncbi:hypothetical protein L7F22_026247 [Adiantum nelumboides]|nr:hypothetical protein [Adiantum nelumboides]
MLQVKVSEICQEKDATLRTPLFGGQAILIPGLSNDVAQLCLAKLARVTLPKLRSVCTAWRRLCESKDFWDLRYKGSQVVLLSRLSVHALTNGGELMRNQYGVRPERGSAEVYDLDTGLWTLIPEMWLDTQKVPGPSTVHCGKILFAHKSKLMMYDDVANNWYHVGYLPGVDLYNDRIVRYGFACESINDELYIVGGLSGQKQNRNFLQALNTTEVAKVRLAGPSKYTLWQDMANMGASEGVVLASAVVSYSG